MNTTGLDVDHPNTNKAYTCPTGKILSVGILEKKCSERGCKQDECCVDEPADGTNIKYTYKSGKCLKVLATEEGDDYFTAEEDCQTANTSCKDLSDQFDIDIQDGDGELLCIDPSTYDPSDKLCDATGLAAILGGNTDDINETSCAQTCCS